MPNKLRSLIVVLLSMLTSIFALEVNAWTVKATFESFELGSDGKDYNTGNGDGLFNTYSPTAYVSDKYAHGGSKSIRFLLEGGKENTHQHSFSLGGPLYEGHEVWARIYVYLPAGFDWTCNPITKLLRFVGADADGSSDSYHSILATHPHSYGCSVESVKGFGYMVTGAERNSKQEPPPICQNRNRDQGPAYLTPGKWHCMEIYIKVSATEGVMRAWHNGILRNEYFYPTIDKGGLFPKRKTSNSLVHHLLGWWNGGVPKDQYIYFDDFIITNERPSNKDAEGNYMIGPTESKGADLEPPSSPNALEIVSH